MSSKSPHRQSRYTWLLVLFADVVFLLPAASTAQQADEWTKARQSLVELIAEGVKDPRVLDAVRKTERHLFVPEEHRANAYFDMSLPIGGGVTISPPYVVAFMTEQLDPRPTDRVLEIGTGSGYQAAILSPLVAEVYTIEIIEHLGNEATGRLRQLGYRNVHVRVGDGFKGWPERAPFDKIIVTCSPEKIPQPLVDQLKEGGKMLIPLGKRYQQSLCLVTKREGKLERRVLESTFFVPMTGHAEELRNVKQDDGVPVLANGSFELLTDEQTPANWYYLRQAQLVSDTKADDGTRYLKLSNATPGRTAQVLQATGLDGRRFKELELSVAVRASDVMLPEEDSFSGIDVRFYNEQRHEVGSGRFGPWSGRAPWADYATRFRVPDETRILMISVGLYGATGELDIDNIRLNASTTVAKGPFD
ncbi:MAG: protein-L-isoaspartate(D-aspartate) O-methyltransferase [Planctomycetota bacterium]|nr:protein-L-isoaspartate(D-aspartate) O-methyltransferase [Planctomycetota bacterium]